MTSVHLTTADGRRLDGDVALPEPGTAIRGGAVVCHPNPLYGGDRFHPVVDTVFRALPDAGFATLRFDFRRERGDGDAERLDLVTALDTLASQLDAAGEVPLVVVGYSFGAVVALNTADTRITACVAIAPPLGAMHGSPPIRPTLVLTPRHDQFCGPDSAAVSTADWPLTELDVIESADHFLNGHADLVAQRSLAWITRAV